MPKRLMGMLALLPWLAAADPAPGSFESVVAATARSSSSTNVALDLRAVWPVEEIVEMPVSYSAVGWDLSPVAAGSVRLVLDEGSFASDGSFVASGVTSDLVSGLTDKGVFAWLPSDPGKRPYRITHEVTRSSAVQSLESLAAYYDFTGLKTTTLEEYLAAVGGRTQPLTLAVGGTWVRLGGTGDGVRTKASGSTLTFAFTGKGSFSFAYRKTGGTLALALDGAAFAAVSDDAADWTAQTNAVAAFGSHTLVITFADGTSADLRDVAFSVDGRTVRSASSRTQALDLRTAFTALTEHDEAFQDFQYAAPGWDIGATDEGAAAAITATPGTLSGGQFVASGGRVLTVASGLAGTGKVDWTPTGASRKVYQLKHEVTKSGSVVADRTLYGYLDLTECRLGASYEDILEATVLPESFTVVLVEDPNEDQLWQPVDLETPYAGFCSAEGLADAAVTVSGFECEGVGTFTCEYRTTGGTTAALLNGVATNLSAVTEWTSLAFAFDGFGTNSVAFRHTVASGSQAFVRNVCWTRPVPTVRGTSAAKRFRADLAMGVRRPARVSDILPFAYSETNWTGVSAAPTVARTTAVRMTGEPWLDCGLWTNEVASTRRSADRAGEATFGWRRYDGVWKVSHAVMSGATAVATETAVLDLRETRHDGLSFVVGAAPAPAPAPSSETVEDIVFADGEWVNVRDASHPLEDPSGLRWRWRAADDAALPAAYKSSLTGFAETKPMKDGAWLGVVGGTRWAIVDVATKTAVAWGETPTSPHTLELIGDGILAVAATEGSHAVALYDISGDRATTPSAQNRTVFTSASGHAFCFPHGLYWDATSEKLWIGGSTGTAEQNGGELNRCTVTYADGTFALAVERTWTVTVGGTAYHDVHDLRRVSGTARLVFTTVEGVQFFDMSGETFVTDEMCLCGASKSCDPSANGKTFLVQIPDHSYNAEKLHLLVRGFDGRLALYRDYRTLSGADIYKARWLPRR